MSFEAVRRGRLPITLGQVAIGGLVAAGARKQCAQAQQRNVEQHEIRLGGHRAQSLDRGRRLADVVLATALQQRFHEGGDAGAEEHHRVAAELLLDDRTQPCHRGVEVTGASLLFGAFHLELLPRGLVDPVAEGGFA